MSELDEKLLERFTAPLLNLPVSHVWRGHGSAIFLEFGELRERFLRDGSPGEPDGEMGLMIEWGWRIEARRKIVCGSESDERLWNRGSGLLKGSTVQTIRSFGRLPEIEMTFSNEARLLSFMTSDGDPRWALFDRTGKQVQTLHSVDGKIQFET